MSEFSKILLCAGNERTFAFLFGLLGRGGEGIQTFLAIPMELVVIFQGIMILSVALTMQWVDRKLTSRERRLGS